MLPIILPAPTKPSEEERRLLYVGVTRARQRLYLSWSLARAPGGRRTRQPSRFLTGLTGRQPSARQQRTARRAAAAADPGPDDRLFRRLRDWRLATARELSLPAYVLFSDATLQAIADARPASTAELARVPGVGAVKLERYGAAVLEVCAENPA